MPSVVGQRGQIVIEKPIRDALGLEPGHLAVQHLGTDHVKVYFYPPEHDNSLRGALANHTNRSVPPEKWSEVREQGLANAVRSDWEKDEESP